MTSRTDTLHIMMSDALAQGGRPLAAEAVPPHRRVLTPAERRAEESTRVAREITEARTEQRQAEVARLKAARLKREAEVVPAVKRRTKS
ncbi:hypothetical protein [Rubellimicrobium mesophilum]|uniref:hypothetical protein n=1 Tax=Rubellimicrobium mesophilum TaxID=1123067 RepID=UPI000567AE13|nr:hypothetical protein [Rubellimicrobium mesophilum]